MRSATENIVAAEQLGYTCLDHFTLPEHCWWNEYYTPWLRHIEVLKDEAKHNDFLQAAIANAMIEIELFRKFNSEYGYEFYVLQK